MKLKFRLHTWGNPTTGRMWFGIQVRTASGVWSHAQRDGKAILFDSRTEAEAAIKEVRKRAREAAA